MTIHAFTIAALPATPWKNGGGITREIACYPLGAAVRQSFLWRMSIATIASDGPFSSFPGIDRVIVLLDGPGVRLTSGDGAVDHLLNRPLQPFAFPGEAEIHGAMLGGMSSDFNLMTRRGEMGAQVKVVSRETRLPAAPHGLLLAASGAWQAEDANGRRGTLNAGAGLWWADQEQGWSLAPASPSARLLTVRILPAARAGDTNAPTTP